MVMGEDTLDLPDLVEPVVAALDELLALLRQSGTGDGVDPYAKATSAAHVLGVVTGTCAFVEFRIDKYAFRAACDDLGRIAGLESPADLQATIQCLEVLRDSACPRRLASKPNRRERLVRFTSIYYLLEQAFLYIRYVLASRSDLSTLIKNLGVVVACIAIALGVAFAVWTPKLQPQFPIAVFSSLLIAMLAVCNRIMPPRPVAPIPNRAVVAVEDADRRVPH